MLLLQGQVFLLLLVQQFTQLDLLLLDGPELLVVVEENALLQLDLSLEISLSGGVGRVRQQLRILLFRRWRLLDLHIVNVCAL